MNDEQQHKKYREMDFLLPAWLERQFSHQENMELELNGCWIRALEQGVLNPINIEHQHLLDVVTGKAEPSTLLEQTWLKYKKLSANGCPCEVCAGVGYYDNPKTGERETCYGCHGAGRVGCTPVQITVEGHYSK
ncbi:DUF413 domain-containing protein [Escherichia coli]|uniref:DUF413 domain-containing protein n=2 Tax=Gammaproteobacteria TaxID=1236 RepID=UPI0008FB92C4|nr:MULTISPECIES: DUF413 domain-containing protein [Enterobacterales]ELZ9638216.1 DUF413 domain-containing protein [Proteus mirabilis]HEB5260844.1 DUF413 domain-containing protein [Klebsiella pneumoniae]APC10894.1 hypothetical protein RB151_012090 [Providencia rettgeri]APC11263.1 hypothetical protein RB151_015830 [Providencia rettgeri]APC11490.1 hypothetical protein RB151_018100 [Providencia rettgeri]|tara:strand:- start:751 stop:1152 length:402 start_codon:yes stop_codon:yes gene_type:complete